MKTAVLLIGFGGPTSMAEVRPFLQSVLEGVRIPQSRFDEVLHHYEIFKGISNYNTSTYRQREALEYWFEKSGASLPVYVGFRHSSPSFQETFEVLKKNGIEKIVVIVLSSFRCDASFEKYVKKLEEAKAASGAASIAVELTETFFKHPLFIRAQSEKIKLIMNDFSKEELDKTFFLFSAHSIPVSMSDKSRYAGQFIEASSLVAKDLEFLHWGYGYQSRSGNPNELWLSPDVKEMIQRLDQARFKSLVMIPLGFLCDHMEILYDLDVEARKSVEALGLKYLRASTVVDHPKFIEMMGNQVLQKIEKSPALK